jgi:hypothetical protein
MFNHFCASSYVDLYAFGYVYMRFCRVYELGVANHDACGDMATSETSAPVSVEHVACVFCRFFVTFSLVSPWGPISVPAALGYLNVLALFSR